MNFAARKWLIRLLFTGITILAFALSRESRPHRNTIRQLVGEYQWERIPLPLILDPSRELATTYECGVQPNLKQVEAWICALGASITIGDLDGDGFCDDLAHTEPRDASLVISKTPFSPGPKRYDPFVLQPPQALSHLTYGPKHPARVASCTPVGTLVGDFNRDGWSDLIVYYWGRSPLIFYRKPEIQTLGATAFQPVELLGDKPEIWHTSAAIQGDFDSDGIMDLLFGGFFADHAPVLGDSTEASATADFRRAHLLEEKSDGSDLRRIPQMQASKARATNGGDLHFFRGMPDGSFATVSNECIRRRLRGQWVLALGAADLDHDGRLDFYVANDFGPDLLASNRSTGPGDFSFAQCMGSRSLSTPKSSQLGHDSCKGMGAAISDINGDGNLDILVSNIATEFGLQEGHFAWINTGNMTQMQDGLAPFVNQAETIGIARSGWGWDMKCADFNNDGRSEILQACGFIRGSRNGWPSLHSVALMSSLALDGANHWAPMRNGIDISGGDRNCFFVNSNGHFIDINAEAIRTGIPNPPFPEATVSRGIAIADMNADGKVDFAVANQWGTSWIYHNTRDSLDSRHLCLSLATPDAKFPNKGISMPPYGATVRISYSKGGRQVSQEALVEGGNGHAGRSAPEVYFGLGGLPADTPIDVSIEWGIDREKVTTAQKRRTPRTWKFQTTPEVPRQQIQLEHDGSVNRLFLDDHSLTSQ